MDGIRVGPALGGARVRGHLPPAGMNQRARPPRALTGWHTYCTRLISVLITCLVLVLVMATHAVDKQLENIDYERVSEAFPNNPEIRSKAVMSTKTTALVAAIKDWIPDLLLDMTRSIPIPTLPKFSFPMEYKTYLLRQGVGLAGLFFINYIWELHQVYAENVQ